MSDTPIDSSHPDETEVGSQSPAMEGRPQLIWRQFGLRDVFWIIIVVAVGAAWWRQSSATPPTVQTAPSSSFINGVQHIDGPLIVHYKQRLSANSTTSATLNNVQSPDFHPNGVIVTYRDGGSVFNLTDLVYFRWTPDHNAIRRKAKQAKNAGH